MLFVCETFCCCRYIILSDCYIVGRLFNITVGLTNIDPRINLGPLNSSIWKCAAYVEPIEVIELKCDEPLYEGRYLFVAATVRGYLQLSEVEVYTGKLWNGGYYFPT